MTFCVPMIMLLAGPPVAPISASSEPAPIATAAPATMQVSALSAPPSPAPLDAAAPDDLLVLGAEPLTAATLSERSGGTADYSVDLGALGVNVATSSGTVSGLTLSGSNTGTADGTSVLGNSGITTVFVNTGNGVVLQNTVQVNVFMNAGE